jgi:hypothetical protein
MDRLRSSWIKEGLMKKVAILLLCSVVVMTMLPIGAARPAVFASPFESPPGTPQEPSATIESSGDPGGSGGEEAEPHTGEIIQALGSESRAPKLSAGNHFPAQMIAPTITPTTQPAQSARLVLRPLWIAAWKQLILQFP